MKNIAPRLMRIKDVAAYLGISVTSVRRLVEAGKIPHPVKKGNRISLYDKAWIDSYVDDILEKKSNSGEAA